MPPGVFRKGRADAPDGFFACEAAGLEWLRAAHGAPVARVVDVGPDHLDLERLTEAAPSREAARAFGSLLAATHDAGAPAFGSPPDGWDGDGFFGPLSDPLALRSGAFAHWGEFYARCRLEPIARQGLERGALGPADAGLLEAVARRAASGSWDDGEPPSRVHGDLWAGNVLWTPRGATLIDPAAHGGHRESDLAMLALFGLPFLDDVVAGYQQAHPLRASWRRRVGLHQLYPVAVHAVLFGGHYVDQMRRLATQCA
ncbi:fructosamine kinase family protein [Cellulomonas chengniuliangii]|uniref:Fructosamine kinase family protein n=1 Tax=Cellulomonas chengniuliangii TaxID=2968084 RepID=A0ABY5L189_9CELL|nr:fructosamine kinase family protein [Cellulomonas chengniuliangii]MCC2308153.1 fructosamine kinase family protein [Cellulomonas chengniuliangii]UUI76547.1 fructosamine kinase family protein [Cellulomonas chengniuliangii]